MKLGRPKIMEQRREIQMSLDNDELKNLDAHIEKFGVNRSEYFRNVLAAQSLSEGDLIARSTSLEKKLALAESRIKELEKLIDSSTNQGTHIDQIEFERVQKAYTKYLSKVKDADETTKLAWLDTRAKSLDIKPMKLLLLLEAEQ